MDKSFVSVDDLVRQRLGGGEEQERPGAWLHMRDLLDKEMPQEKRRIGFFYWRRMLGALGALSLLATISLGGYELTANRNGSVPGLNHTPPVSLTGDAKQGHTTASAVAAPSTTVTTIPNNSNSSNNPSSAQASQLPGQRNLQSNTAVKNDENKTYAYKATLNSRNNVGVAQPSPANEISNSEVSAIMPTTDAGSRANQHSGHELAKAPASAHVPANPGIAMSSATTTRQPASARHAIASRHSSGVAVGVSKPQKVQELALSSAAPAGHTSTTPASVRHASRASVTGLNKAVSKKIHTAAPNKEGSRLATAATSKNSVAAIKGVKLNTPAHKATVSKNIVPASSAPALASAAKRKAATNSVNKVNSVMPGTSRSVSATTAPVASVAPNEKVSMQKLVIYESEHYIKTDPENGYFKHDTISMKAIMEKLAANEPNMTQQPATSAPVASGAPARVAPGISGTTPSTPTGGAIGSTSSAIASSQILPGASASAAGKPALGQNSNASAGKSSGAGGGVSALQNAFNDIKYNVNGMHLTAGLTAGINSTFFGPADFHGFQFGVTGDLIFNDNWSIGTALKYFERINNNYSLNDNYTASNGSGGYNQITNIYSFPTLHSIEMPLTLRYTNGKFSFFLGGNLVYSFAINEGYLQTTTPLNGSGTASEPKVNAATDFGARFGVGCAFGIAYQVTHNVNLDLRNVMTLWDNAGTDGAKYISDQVYKSPSLQLSVGYRLGKKAPKE